MTIHKIYIYSENCTLKGRIYHGENAEDFGDVSLWGAGTADELIQQALDTLATRYDLRAGGAADCFRWKCGREVLRYLDGPKVEFNRETMAYLPAVEESEEAE